LANGGGVVTGFAITSEELKTALSAAVTAIEVKTFCFDDESAICRDRN
jgi:hypothetical protein